MKFTVAFDPLGRKSNDWAEKMAQPLCRFGHQAVSEEVGCFGLGCVATFDRHSRISMVWRSGQANVLVISGVPIIRQGRAEDVLQAIVEANEDDAVERISQLDGAFTAVLMYRAQDRCVVVSDFLGLQPVYYYHGKEGLLLSSDLKAVCAVRAPKPDPAGWGEFVGFGHSIGTDTQCKDVHRLRGGTVLRYSAATNELDSETYWRPPTSSTLQPHEVDPSWLVKMVEDDIAAYQQYSDKGTVLLSGGFDSRLIAAILNRMNIAADAQIVQHEGHFGGAEGKYAIRVADRLCQGTVTYVRPDRRFYSSDGFAEYLWANEVMTPSESLFIAQVAAIIRPHMRAVWEGVCPGYAFVAPCQPRGGFEAFLTQGNIAYEQGDWRWETVRRVFHSDFAEAMYSGMGRNVQAEIDRLGDDEYGVRKFILQNRMANRTAPNPTKVYTNYVIPFVPGCNRDLWGAVLRIPYSRLKGYGLYRALYRKEFPELLEIPFCSEKGVFSAQRASPAQLARKARAELMYQYGKVKALLRARQHGKIRTSGDDGSVLSRVANRVNLDRPEIDPDGVRRVLRTGRRGGKANQYAFRLVGYWSAWNHVMSGESLL